MIVKLTACFLAVTLLEAPLAAAAEADAMVFAVQLIRGTNQDAPEDPKWKPVGEKLSGKLQSVFRWKNYWEVGQEKVTLKKGKSGRTRLSKEREIEVELADPDTLEIRLYKNGVLTRRTRGPKEIGTRILGGDKGGEESWFVVVSREAPKASK